MRDVRLYVGPDALSEGTFTLAGQPARHAQRVLRLRQGDTVTLFDGSGRDFPATIVGHGKERLELEVAAGQVVDRESVLQTCLALAIPRGERMDMAVQKATELGVSRIQPLQSARTVVRLDGERGRRRTQHWRGVAAAACEQSGRSRLPDIGTTATLVDWLAALPDPGKDEIRIVALPGAQPPGAETTGTVSRAVTMLVGPEGGFSDEEVRSALETGFLAIGLGPRVLRTETAAQTLLGLAQWLWGDLGPGRRV